MKFRFACLLLLAFGLACTEPVEVYSQTNDSVYHRFNPGWTKYYFLNDIDKLEIIDTSIEVSHRYHQGFDEFNEMQTGNLGLASFRFSPQFPQNVGYRVGIDAYNEYLFTPDNTPFYSTRRPYTVLNYVLGTKNEQYFSGIHTQNISKQYNFNFRFMRLGSEGTFARQRADWFNLGLGQSFTTKNQRYYLQALVYQNKGKLEQNGGITVSIDSAYNEVYFDRKLVPVRLDSALTTIRERGIFAQHGFQFVKYYNHKADTATQKIYYPIARIQHRFDYSRYRYKFHDDAIDFDRYDFVFINPLKTNDSIQYDRWTNELRLELTEIKSQTDSTKSFKLFSGNVAMAHEYWQFIHPDSNSYLEDKSNLIAKLDFKTNFMQAVDSKRFLRNLYLNLNGEYDLTGYNENDYKVISQVGYRLGAFFPNVFYRRAEFSPSPLQEYYHGNHYQWDNSFEKTTTNIIGGFLYYRLIRGSISYSIYNVTNPIYFSDNAQPAQLLGTVNGYSISISPNISVGHFHLDARWVWQSYDNSILNYPDFYTTTSLYYSGNLFKKALMMAAGVDGRYNTAYDAPGFEPNTSQFYLQHLTQSGDYIWLDAFLNLKIRSVRLSLVGQNLLQGVLKSNTFSATPYPMPDRSFKLRVDWMFWN